MRAKRERTVSGCPDQKGVRLDPGRAHGETAERRSENGERASKKEEKKNGVEGRRNKDGEIYLRGWPCSSPLSPAAVRSSHFSSFFSPPAMPLSLFLSVSPSLVTLSCHRFFHGSFSEWRLPNCELGASICKYQSIIRTRREIENY